MNDIFRDLKQTMDETVLKDIDFTEEHKRKIRSAVNQNQARKKFSFKSKIDFVLSAAVICLFLTGIGYLSAVQIGLFEDKKLSSDVTKEQTLKKDILKKEDTAIYTPVEKKESNQEMTKEDVQQKMLNSMDYYETATGKFENRYVFEDNRETISVYEYKISFKQHIVGYEKVKDSEGEEYQTYFDKYKHWTLVADDRGKRYREQPLEYVPDNKMIRMEEVIKKEKNRVLKVNLRKRPPLKSSVSLFPGGMALEYLKDKDLWEIEKQNKKVLGHNTIVVIGTVRKDPNSTLKMDTFRFWIDKDTGVLVKFEGYDQQGNLTCYLHPESLNINVPINTEDIKPNLEGFEKEEGLFYRDDREKDIKIRKSADGFSKELKTLIDTLHRNLPYLYEFTHPDMQLFSASYETYKEDKQGYLSYSYKKPNNEPGSGSKMLFTRTYPKGSVVRSWGEFNSYKGKRLGEITVNGIRWEYYEVQGREDYLYIGESNNYIYEILSQQINPNETNELLKNFKPANPI